MFPLGVAIILQIGAIIKRSTALSAKIFAMECIALVRPLLVFVTSAVVLLDPLLHFSEIADIHVLLVLQVVGNLSLSFHLD